LVEIRWHGHSCFEAQGQKVVIVFDPFGGIGLPEPKAKADIVLCSHGHGDHFGDIMSIAERTDALVISNFEIATYLENKGLKTHAQHLGGGFQHPFGYLKLTLALHGSALPDGSYGGNPAGFLLTTEAGEKIYLACDTGLFGDMKLIGETGVELAVLPIGDLFTMGPGDSIEAIKMIQPRRVAPAHYNTWPPIEQDAAAWAEQVRTETSAEPIVLEPGGKIVL